MKNTAWTLKALQALGLVLTVSLIGCAQSRTGIGAGQKQVELWKPQSLCVNVEGQAVLACVEVQLDITNNLAYIDVQQLGFDPAQTPYRVFARRNGDGAFALLQSDGGASVQTTAPGGSFSVNAPTNHYIEEYQEWIIEIGTRFDDNGYEAAATPGQGLVAARAIIQWPELATDTGTANTGTSN